MQDFMLVCGLTSYPADAVLEDILEDPRAALHMPAWKASAQDEIAWLQSWDLSLYHEIVERGLTKQLGPKQLQDKVMHGSMVAYAFIDHQCFEPAGRFPWCLAQGDILANLAALKDGPDAIDHTTGKIQQLMRGGANVNEMVLAVRLLGDCSWSTTTVEQQHASVTMIHRHHP